MLAKNPAKYFIRKDVQEILIKVTGCDLNKIFKPSFNPGQELSKIELLTNEQLELENKKSLKKARKLLQMPPFLNPRTNQEIVLSQDEKLDPINLNKTNYIFTDISLNVPNKNRLTVVREPNGILRKANFEERERVLQVYFPKEKKPTYSPKMFNQLNLEECLKLRNYLIVLNKACLKYEPNDPEFIRVTHRVYEHINEHKEFDKLYSTRFFGPMVFYLAWFKKFDNIISYMLNSSKIDDCAEIINLYLIVNEIKRDNIYSSPIALIQNFIEKHMKGENASAELALKKILESNKNKKASASN